MAFFSCGPSIYITLIAGALHHTPILGHGITTPIPLPISEAQRYLELHLLQTCHLNSLTPKTRFEPVPTVPADYSSAQCTTPIAGLLLSIRGGYANYIQTPQKQ